MNQMPMISLGECFRVKHGFAFKGAYFAKSGNYVVLTPGNFREDGGLKSQGEKEKYYCVTPPDEYILSEGDLLIVMTDLTQEARILGRPAVIPLSNKYLHNQRLGLVTQLDQEKLTKEYLYYLLNWSLVRNQIKATATGSTVRHTAPDRIHAVQVRLPSLDVQHRIASILSAYDDLIENNSRRIEILEEMARRLYEEWFVQFRFPGYEGVEFKESELGLIPVGWDLVPLGDIYRTGSGGTPSRKNPDFFGGDYRWVKTKELQDCPVFDTEEKISEDGLQKSSAKLFPRNTVLIAMYGATIGRLGVLQEESATNQACCAILPNSQGCGWGYAYLSLFSRRQALVDLRAGAAQQNISQDVIKKFKLLRASDELHEQFEMAVTPFLKLCFILYRKNANLRAQRDLLLPRLISGEIDVSDIPMAT